MDRLHDFFETIPNIPIRAYFNRINNAEFDARVQQQTMAFVSRRERFRFVDMKFDILKRYHFNVLSVYDFKYFPLNFAAALLQYALSKPTITVWYWGEIIQNFFKQPTLSWELGLTILDKVRQVRNQQKNIVITEEEWAAFQKETQEVFKIPGDDNPLPVEWIQKFVQIEQKMKWQLYDETIVGIQAEWIQRLLVNEKDAEVRKKMIVHLPGVQVRFAGRQGGFVNKYQMKPQLLLLDSLF